VNLKLKVASDDVENLRRFGRWLPLWLSWCLRRRPTKPEFQGATMEKDSRETELSNVIRIDDERVREHLGRIVRVLFDLTQSS
jgi:hypothetical protein